MMMPGREYQAQPSRFGFNGQESSHEIKGFGNSYSALFWEYDTRLGQRWNLDPKPNLSLSPYSTFSNNPISLTDHFGDTLDIGTNKESTTDLFSILKNKDNSQYFNIAQYSGNVTLTETFFKLSFQEQRSLRRNDRGFALIYDLVTDKHRFYFANSNIRRYNQTNIKTNVTELVTIRLTDMFPAGTILKGSHEENTRTAILMERNTLYYAFNNLAFTPRGDEKDFRFTPSYKGFNVRTYHGEVWMARGKYYDQNMLELPRASFVFHELLENFIRVNGENYPNAHAQAIAIEAGFLQFQYQFGGNNYSKAPYSLFGNKTPGTAQNFKLEE